MSHWIGIFGGFAILIGGMVMLFPNLAPQWLAYVLGIIGGITIGFWIKAIKIPKWQYAWSKRYGSRSLYPFRRLIALTDATQVAYEKSQHLLVGAIAERFSDNPPEVLSYYATALFHGGEIPLFGTKPPSSRHSEVPAEELKMCTFSNGATELVRFAEKTPLYTNLAIRNCDFRLRLRELKSWDLPDS